jgi:hypothetical protein
MDQVVLSLAITLKPLRVCVPRPSVNLNDDLQLEIDAVPDPK